LVVREPGLKSSSICGPIVVYIKRICFIIKQSEKQNTGECTEMKRTALALTLALLALSLSATAGSMGKKDIVDTAVAAGKFNTLAAALKAAGLVDTLKGPGPFTVFAPTDEAFAKLPAARWMTCSSRKITRNSSQS
jgi:uncharacterized surface protein with fasciclin (FAS1) repeats